MVVILQLFKELQRRLVSDLGLTEVWYEISLSLSFYFDDLLVL